MSAPVVFRPNTVCNVYWGTPGIDPPTYSDVPLQQLNPWYTVGDGGQWLGHQLYRFFISPFGDPTFIPLDTVTITLPSVGGVAMQLRVRQSSPIFDGETLVCWYIGATRLQ